MVAVICGAPRGTASGWAGGLRKPYNQRSAEDMPTDPSHLTADEAPCGAAPVATAGCSRAASRPLAPAGSGIAGSKFRQHHQIVIGECDRLRLLIPPSNSAVAVIPVTAALGAASAGPLDARISGPGELSPPATRGPASRPVRRRGAPAGQMARR